MIRPLILRQIDLYRLAQFTSAMNAAAHPKPKSVNLMVRLDPAGKAVIERAAARRHLSTSDYLRTVVVAQADKELRQAQENTIALTPSEQEAFWSALQADVGLTPKQRNLGRLMRGDT